GSSRRSTATPSRPRSRRWPRTSARSRRSRTPWTSARRCAWRWAAASPPTAPPCRSTRRSSKRRTMRSRGGGWRTRRGSALNRSSSDPRPRRRSTSPRSTASMRCCATSPRRATPTRAQRCSRRRAGCGPTTRALLAATGERAGLLETIAKGALPEANRFAHNLAVVSAAYKAPDASATTVLGALFGAFPVADATTRAALERIARDFDAARAFAERWEAADLWAEIAAELAGARPASRAVEGVAPAAPVPDEPAAPVAVRKLSFSASSLNAYAECARKWWFRYVCAAVEDRGSSASFYGIAFHAALEDFHEAHVRFDGVDAEALGRELDGRVVAAFDRHRTRFEAPVEFELQKRRARRTAVKYLAWLLERARRTPFEVIGCETAADVELGGHR